MLHDTYTATGQKISQQLEDVGRLGTRREYAGPFVYVNSTLWWINTIYGRIVAVPKGGLRKELHLRDHTSTSLSTGLGNTRMVLEERDRNYEVVQEAAYYPFGMAIPSQSFALPNENDTYQNRYLYNGKEYQDDFGLDWYDYGARFYDAQIGRWHSLDPLAEFYYAQSPYNYVANDPINFIDPDGNFRTRFGAWLYKLVHGGDVVNRKGKTRRVDNTGGDDYDVIWSEDDYYAGNRDYDESGTSSGIKVSKSFMSSKLPRTINITNAEGTIIYSFVSDRYLLINSDVEATRIHMFMDLNTDVEWSNSLLIRPSDGYVVNLLLTSF